MFSNKLFQRRFPVFVSDITKGARKPIIVVSAATGSTTAAFGVLVYYFTSTTSSSSSTSFLEENRKSNVADPTKITTPAVKRSDQMSQLRAASGRDTGFDVLIVGGGATGCGAALDAASRGLSTALIERGDFGTETSARSTKLIWAGIRYIATAVASLFRVRNFTRPIDAIQDFMGEFKMVLGAHKERRIMLENNPHLTNWVPIAIPMSNWISWPPPFGHPLFASAPITLPFVFKFYDSLSGFTCPPSHIMGRKRALRKFPQLDQDAKYFQIFYEGQHNDSRTNTYIALTAAEHGATVSNYVEMINIITDTDTGKAIGVKCRENLTNDVFDVYAKSIVFAGGPFTDEMRKIEDPKCELAVNAAAGTHIVLPGFYCPGGIGMLDINTSDGRFLFFLPWEGSTLVGTTDRKGPVTSYHGPPEEEINWLLKEVQKYLTPDVQVRRSDVLSAWQGFRPLASDPNALPGAPISRDHIISTNPQTGITFITGGKWVTYREMAEDVIDKVIELHSFKHAKPCMTDKVVLRGGVGYHRNLPIQLVQKYGVNEVTAKHLARSYGVLAFDVCEMAEPTNKAWPRFGSPLIEGYPYLECEITYQCRNEMVCTVKDMISLRFRIAYLNKDAALAIAPRVADVMAKELKWNKKERDRQLKDAIDLINTFGGPYPSKDDIDRTLLQSIHDVRDLFRSFDNDKSGYIDYTEFKGFIDALGITLSESSEKEIRNAFSKIDIKNTGKITEDDFILWWKNSSSKSDLLLKSNLGDRVKLSAEKMGKGVGAGFG